jgi:hypothetical protein
MFIEKTYYQNNFPEQLKVQDLNVVIPKKKSESAEKKVEESLFSESVVFSQGDMRSYMYLISSIDEKYKLDNTKEHELGFFQIYWRNYLGDYGVLTLGPFRSMLK